MQGLQGKDEMDNAKENGDKNPVPGNRVLVPKRRERRSIGRRRKGLHFPKMQTETGMHPEKNGIRFQLPRRNRRWYDDRE